MSNVAAQGRCDKLYDAVACNGGAATERIVAERLNWEISSVRSTASQLVNQGKLHVEKAADTWVLFVDNIPIEVPSAFLEKKVDLSELASEMVNAITAYVEAIISNRK